MKKWQEWTIAIVAIILVVGAIGGVYWYLTDDAGSKEVSVTVETTQEEKDLSAVNADLQGIEDLDLAALETIDKDLQAIDLSSL